MPGLPEQPRGAREVVGADDDRVDALHVEDRLEVADRVDVLDLHDPPERRRRFADVPVVRHHPVADGAPRAEAAHARRGVEARGHRGLRLLRGADHRKDDARGSHLQHGLREHGVVPRDAHEGRGPAGLGGHQVLLQRAPVDGGMLGVDPQEIEPDAGEQLADGRVEQAHVRADHQLVRGDLAPDVGKRCHTGQSRVAPGPPSTAACSRATRAARISAIIRT